MRKIRILLDLDGSANNWHDNYILLYNFYANLKGKSNISELTIYNVMKDPNQCPEIASKVLQCVDKGLSWLPHMKELIIELVNDEKVDLQIVSRKKRYLDETIDKLLQLGVKHKDIQFLDQKQWIVDKFDLIIEDSDGFVKKSSEETRAKTIIVEYLYNQEIKDDVLFYGSTEQVRDFVLECINIIELD